jgi:hypothetical protein
MRQLLLASLALATLIASGGCVATSVKPKCRCPNHKQAVALGGAIYIVDTENGSVKRVDTWRADDDFEYDD